MGKVRENIALYTSCVLKCTLTGFFTREGNSNEQQIFTFLLHKIL